MYNYTYSIYKRGLRMNKKMKKLALGMVGLAAVATLAACGNGKSATNQVDKVKKAGGVIFSEPEDFEVGYTFGFTDPDGHKFNFLYWPGM